jgi:hypothetical protein
VLLACVAAERSLAAARETSAALDILEEPVPEVAELAAALATKARPG